MSRHLLQIFRMPNSLTTMHAAIQIAKYIALTPQLEIKTGFIMKWKWNPVVVSWEWTQGSWLELLVLYHLASFPGSLELGNETIHHWAAINWLLQSSVYVVHWWCWISQLHTNSAASMLFYSFLFSYHHFFQKCSPNSVAIQISFTQIWLMNKSHMHN